MKSKSHVWFLILCALALIPSLFFKHLPPSCVDFLLYPTQALTGFFTGSEFYFNSEKGYLSDELRISIGTSCSGISISLVFIFLLAYKLFTGKNTVVKKIALLFSGLPLIYIFVIGANLLRILLALYFLSLSHVISALGKPVVHEIAGLAWYTIALVLFWHFLNKKGTGNIEKPMKNEMVT